MRSRSADGGENRTPLERGPLGPGGVADDPGTAHRGGLAVGSTRFRRLEQTGVVLWRMSGSDLTRKPGREGSMLNFTVPGA